MKWKRFNLLSPAGAADRYSGPGRLEGPTVGGRDGRGGGQRGGRGERGLSVPPAVNERSHVTAKGGERVIPAFISQS